MSHGFGIHACCNFIYVRKKSATFSAPIFAKLTNTRQRA